MIISKTPLRISFAGGGTDFPSFYKENNYGAVLSTSIDCHIYVSIKKHSSLFNEKIRLNYSETELVDDIDKIKNSIIRECLRFLNFDDRVYISTIADAPAMSGLGSSSSFCVGLLNALYAYKGIRVSPGRLAEEAAYIELDVLNGPIGKQDQYAAAFGGLNLFTFHSDGSASVKPVHISDNLVSLLSNSMISFWTKQTRLAETILTEQKSNSIKNTELLLAIRAQAEEMSAFLCDSNFNVERFGKIINNGWEMKRKLASKITSTFFDHCYEVALKNGAFGGKISGAGGGGFFNIFAPPEKHPVLLNELQKLGLVPYKFNFEPRGTSVSVFG